MCRKCVADALHRVSMRLNGTPDETEHHHGPEATQAARAAVGLFAEVVAMFSQAVNDMASEDGDDSSPFAKAIVHHLEAVPTPELHAIVLTALALRKTTKGVLDLARSEMYERAAKGDLAAQYVTSTTSDVALGVLVEMIREANGPSKPPPHRWN